MTDQSVTGDAAEPARREGLLTRRAAQAEQMAQIISRVASAEDVDGALEQLLRGAMDLLGGRRAVVRLLDPERRACVRSMYLEPDWTSVRIEGAPHLWPGSIGEQIAGGGDAVLVADYGALPESFPRRADMLQRGYRSSVNVPIDVDGKRIGSVHVNHSDAGYFTDADLELASALASLASGAIERARLEAERAAHARLDAALLVARTVAHEINNALSPVTGYAELLLLSPAVAQDVTRASYTRAILQASADVAEKVQRLQRIIRLEEAPSPLGADKPVLDMQRSTTEP